MATTTHWDTSTENHCEAVISAFYYTRNWFSIFLCDNIKHEVYLHVYEWLHNVIFYSGLLYLRTSSKLLWSCFCYNDRATGNNGNGLAQSPNYVICTEVYDIYLCQQKASLYTDNNGGRGLYFCKTYTVELPSMQ